MAYPRGLPSRYKRLWDNPTSLLARRSAGFHRAIWNRGFASPHFSKGEFRCKDGTHVPDSLRVNCQRHAFNLERFRKEVGSISLPILSGYRHRAYNDRIGGARSSQHIRATATDFSVQTVNKVGRRRFFAAAEKVFHNGGVGQYPAGSSHLDSRGYRARWSSFRR